MNSTTEQNLLSPPAIPAEEKFVTIDGARMRYLQAGSGPPLILLHGLMGYSFSWRFTIPVLSQHATVYAVDQVGTGFSDRPAQLDCRLCAIADRFLKFLDAVGVSSFNLLGTSHGGAVAMMAAAACANRPDLRLRKLVLVAPVNPWSPHGRRLAPFLGSSLGSTLFLRTVNHMRWTFPYWLARLYGDSKRIPPGTLEGYEAPVLSIPGSFEYGVGIVRHWTNDLRELAITIPKLADIPTLLIWGSADPAVYAHSAEQLRRHFKRCELVVYPGVGHLPYEEVPDQFNATLLEFLKRP
ncbi:MAG TPA: alpha/beta hydrolase [Terriglobales bacterium]|nr:alpha/beta hydrolase [Terriglobales bacterium]